MTFSSGFFSLRKRPTPAGGAARAQAADEVRDLPFGVFPDFGAGGAVVRLRIARILVLIRVVGVGNFARQFFRHRIVAARILRLDRCRAHDHLGAKRFQQIDFFARLFVRDREDDFVSPHRSDQRKPHARVAGRCLHRLFRPDLSRPLRSASSIIETAMRSFIEPPGFR